MVKQLVLALGLTAITAVIHAIGSVYFVLPLTGIWTDRDGRQRGAAVSPLIRLVSGLLLLHVVEMCIWAGAFYLWGVLPDFETSLYFSLTSYTTVGYGDVLPSVSWRLIGPIEAAVGVLMLGWSTGFIVAAVQRIFGNRPGPPPSI
jgi:hypothetical protein